MSASEVARVAAGTRWAQVLLATSDPQVRRSFTALIRAIIPDASLQAATSVREALSVLRRARPELMLLDSALVQQSPIGLIHHARSARNSSCVVILGTTAQYSRLVSALLSEASACLIIEDPPDALARQLQAILSGDLALSTSAACAVFGQLRQLLPPVAQMSRLSTQESEALRCAATGMTLAEAARRMGIRHATARTYLRRAYTKLGIGSRAQACQAAIALGLLQAQAPANHLKK